MDVTQWSPAFERLSERAAAATPAVLVAVGLLLFGWVLAYSCRFIAKRLLGHIVERIESRFEIHTARAPRSGLWRTGPQVLGEGVFWVILAFVSAAAIEKLPVPMVAESARNLAYFLPKVLLAAIIVFAGIGVGSLAHHRIAHLFVSAGFERAEILGRLVQGSIIVVAVVTGAQQLGLETGVFTSLGTVVVGAVLGGMALAFGLGSAPVVANIMASHYAAKALEIGTVVKVGNISGTVQEITTTTIILDTTGGHIHVPARKYCEESCEVGGPER